METLKSSLECHNVYKRVGALSSRLQHGDLGADDIAEYRKLDETITASILGAEKKLPKRGARLWTTKLGRLVHQARYYCLLLRRAKGLAYHQSVLAKVKDKAKVTADITEVEDIRKRLKDTWTNINKLQDNDKAAREKHLEDLAASTSEGTTIQAIKQIKHQEHTRWRFRRIRNTLNRIKAGGLSGVDVPILGADGNIRGWKSITEKKDLHETVVERNLQHLHQASSTPVGQGAGMNCSMAHSATQPRAQS